MSDDRPSIAELQRQRARHSCILALSSMNCLACKDGVPYPALTIQEIEEALRQGREDAESAYPALFGRPGRYP